VKRFEFSLERLLKVKRQRERLAEMEQARARMDVDEARARVEALRQRLARVGEEMGAFVGQVVAPHHWAAQYELSEQIGRSLHAGEQDVEKAEQRLWEASQERAQIATEVEALATLRKKQWDQYRQEFQQAEQERLDEVGLRRWMAAQKDEPDAEESPAP
jgi:flagellar FliJ protein